MSIRLKTKTNDNAGEIELQKVYRNLDSKNNEQHQSSNLLEQSAQPLNIELRKISLLDNLEEANAKESKPNDKILRKRPTIEKNYGHARTLNNLKFFDYNTLSIKSRLENLSKLELSFNNLEGYDEKELKVEYNRLRRNLQVFDFIIAFLDLYVVTSLYFEHFDYLEQLKISDTGNILRIVAISISFITTILLVLSFYNKIKFENVKYILSYNPYILFANRKAWTLIIEIVIHIIQPYPSVQVSWTMKILNNEVTYTLNMILFILSLMRLYTVLKAIRYWNYYSSEKALRILRLYKNKFLNVFLYKVIIKVNSYIALGLLFVSILYMFALLFKVLENYTAQDLYGFSSFYNCLWYLISTMTATGYGDFVPKTLIGRIIGVFCCIIGTFLLSLVVITLIIFSQFTNEEQKVRKILYLYRPLQTLTYFMSKPLRIITLQATSTHL